MLLDITIHNFYDAGQVVSSHQFEAPTPGELQRWSNAVYASPLEDALMLTAQPSEAAAHQLVAARAAAAAVTKKRLTLAGLELTVRDGRMDLTSQLQALSVTASKVRPLHLKAPPPPPQRDHARADPPSEWPPPWSAPPKGRTADRSSSAAAALPSEWPPPWSAPPKGRTSTAAALAASPAEGEKTHQMRWLVSALDMEDSLELGMVDQPL